MRIRSPKDFWAGLMFIGAGLFAMVWALNHYQFGTALRMGPGYFPAVLGGLLAALGAVIFAGSFVLEGAKLPHISLRPLLLVLAAVVVYGYLMKPLGLILATMALVIVSALGGHEFRWKEVLILGVVLVVFSIGVFVKGLTLPFPLCPPAIDDKCSSLLRFDSEQKPAEPAEKRKQKR